MGLLRNVVASRAPQAATLAAPSAQRPATSVALHNNQPLCICICDCVFVVDHDNVCLFSVNIQCTGTCLPPLQHCITTDLTKHKTSHYNTRT